MVLMNVTSGLTKNRKQKDIRLVITMEATGVYYENCALFLFRKGIYNSCCIT